MSLLPSDDRRYLGDCGIAYREVSNRGNKGIVLIDFKLPVSKFQVPTAEILILLPPGYPDASPDMFYVLPWLELASGGGYPCKADQPWQFEGENWQRWSRHNSEWRAGTDGFRTMVLRVRRALWEAA